MNLQIRPVINFLASPFKATLFLSNLDKFGRSSDERENRKRAETQFKLLKTKRSFMNRYKLEYNITELIG